MGIDNEGKQHIVRRNRSYNFSCIIKTPPFAYKVSVLKKSQMFDTMSLYTVGSMYRQEWLGH